MSFMSTHDALKDVCGVIPVQLCFLGGVELDYD